MTKKILLVTETPPETPNGFGVTLKCLFKNTSHKVIYTDAEFEIVGKTKGYLLAQVPFHRSKKYFLPFLLGKLPEWRSLYSSAWLKQNINNYYSTVYAFVYSFECMRFAAWISKKEKKPLIIHLADHTADFETPYAQNILMEAKKLVCISEAMKFRYEKTLGRNDIEILHNGAESACFNIPAPHNVSFSKENPFKICFIGGLFSDLHGESIEDVFEAVKNIRFKKPWVEFHLYGQRQPKDFLSHLLSQKGCYDHGLVMPLEKKFEIMEEASCFVIPSSFNEQKHSNYRYSFPTKLPELIAAGRPIISYGPENTSTNKILKENHIGIHLHNRCVWSLSKLLCKIIDQYSDLIAQEKERRSYYENRFSADLARNKFSKILAIN